MQALEVPQKKQADRFVQAADMLITLCTLPRQTPWDTKWRLCHGVVTLDGVPHTYPWLEHHVIAFDVATRTLHLAAAYRQALCPVPDAARRYTPRRLQHERVRTGHSGPFVEKLQPPILYPVTDTEPDRLRGLKPLVTL
ncbi:MAG: hypothetical protein EOO40_00260 [Deltaproteobacteria bacterium]|nr:MAG: hypothetical protein EOO40_00260 [Deltaproteobacteria bacterium]